MLTFNRKAMLLFDTISLVVAAIAITAHVQDQPGALFYAVMAIYAQLQSIGYAILRKE